MRTPLTPRNQQRASFSRELALATHEASCPQGPPRRQTRGQFSALLSPLGPFGLPAAPQLTPAPLASRLLLILSQLILILNHSMRLSSTRPSPCRRVPLIRDALTAVFPAVPRPPPAPPPPPEDCELLSEPWKCWLSVPPSAPRTAPSIKSVLD